MRVEDRKQVVEALLKIHRDTMSLEKAASREIRKRNADKKEARQFRVLHRRRAREIASIETTLRRAFPYLKSDPEFRELIVTVLRPLSQHAKEALAKYKLVLPLLLHSMGSEMGQPNHLKEAINRLARRRTDW